MSSTPLFDVPEPEPVPSRWQRPGWPAAVALLVAGLLLGILLAPRQVQTVAVPGPERTPAVCVRALDEWQSFKEETAGYVGLTGAALGELDWQAYRVAAEDFDAWLNRKGPYIDGLDATCRRRAATETATAPTPGGE